MDERSNLVSLHFVEFKVSDVFVVKDRGNTGRSFEPTSNRVPGESACPRDGRSADSLDAQENDVVKRIAGGLDSVVGRARVGGERPTATGTPVSSSLASLGLEEAVPDDVPLARFVVVLTIYMGHTRALTGRTGYSLRFADRRVDLSPGRVDGWAQVSNSG